MEFANTLEGRSSRTCEVRYQLQLQRALGANAWPVDPFREPAPGRHVISVFGGDCCSDFLFPTLLPRETEEVLIKFSRGRYQSMLQTGNPCVELYRTVSIKLTLVKEKHLIASQVELVDSSVASKS